MSIPNGWTEVTNGEWGLGTEPLPGNVPVGPRYVDAHGNRCVMTPDNNGTPKVEGIGTGVNAGKPDGEWWDWTPDLAAGPTNADAWIAADGEGHEENPAAVATPEQATPAPAVAETPAPEPTPAASTAPAPVAPAPAAKTVTVTLAVPAVVVERDQGRWIATEWDAAGRAVAHEVTMLRHAFQRLEGWIGKHLTF